MPFEKHKPTAHSTSEAFVVSGVWVAVVYGSYPLTAKCLRHVTMQGCRERAFKEVFLFLIKDALVMCLIWSLKDFVNNLEWWVMVEWFSDDADDPWPNDSTTYWFNNYNNSAHFTDVLDIRMLTLTLGFSVVVADGLRRCNWLPDAWNAGAPWLLTIGIF